MLLAITREVPSAIAACELTHLDRVPIDVDLAREQHAAYEALLREAGCEVVRAPPLDEQPDSVFVEDAAIVTDEIAIITRPGAASRRPETLNLASVLHAYRPTVTIAAPATIDGGDVLRVGRTFFVGRSSRTNDAACDQLREHLAAFGYTVIPVEVAGCLHLKSAATAVRDDTVLLNRQWARPETFRNLRLIDVDPSEPFGANTLTVGDRLFVSASSPRTGDRLAGAGFNVVPVDLSELAKAEGALTCCSVIFEASNGQASRLQKG